MGRDGTTCGDKGVGRRREGRGEGCHGAEVSITQSYQRKVAGKDGREVPASSCGH